MWKVLLVEDEVFIRRSLKQLISWEELGFTIAQEAGDGQEALELMRADPPDLVISDIIMPGMDGIELLKRAREEGMEASFVMLTCMNEFEYARQALDFGALAYMLKLSMNVRSLEVTLAKAKRELARNLQARSQAVEHSFQRLYRETWQAIRNSSLDIKSWDWEQQLPPEDTDLLRNNVKAESVWVGTFLHGTNRFTLDDFLEAGLVTPGSRSVLHAYVHMGQTTVFVWNPANIRSWGQERGCFPWPAGCSAVVKGREMAMAWSRVVKALESHWYGERSGLVHVLSDEASAGGKDSASGRLPDKDVTLQVATESLTWKTEREWIRSFEQRKLDEFKLRLLAGWAEVRERRLPIAAVKEMALRIDRLLARIAGCTAAAEEELLSCVNHAELVERLLSSAERYASRNRATALPLTGHPEIDKAVAHVHRHYSSDMTLKAVAALVAMDEAYFSGLFKKKTGVTLIHYIQQVRIDHAKGLLEQSELPVVEIGERVGFPNANYFNKIFKRWAGQTPCEYRAERK